MNEDWEAIKDLLDHSKLLQAKFPAGKTTLSIPIELMEKATEYAKEIELDIELKDLSDEIENHKEKE